MEFVERFSLLFREIEREIGTRDLNILLLKAFRDAIRTYKGKTIDSLYEQMRELMKIFNNTEPKFAIVIESFFQVFEQIHHCVLQAEERHKHGFIGYRACIVNAITMVIKNSRKEWKSLMKHAEKLNFEGKTILIHDHSHTVQDILSVLKQQNQNFRVIVAEQDMEKTLSNIEMLSEKGIPFQAVPAYMLSNIEDEIDVCFFGCVTLKSTMDFVVDTGTNAVISQFHLQKKPIYMFLTTSKFSLWKAQKKEVVRRHHHVRKHPLKDLTFERFKFSHDRVSLDSVDFTVTEEGKMTPAELKRLYRLKFDEHKEMTEKFLNL